VGECAQLWIAAKATTKAPSSDWSIIRRSDGSKQWALLGQPLYTYAKESKIGEAGGATEEHGGWRPARYAMAKMELPPGLAVREVPDLFGQVLVNWEGRTLYLFKESNPEKDYSACHSGKEDCGVHWTPVAAPALAERVGDFTVLRRRDGTAQWAYKGRGLYSYDRDAVPGIAEGREAEPLFQPAMIRRTFAPNEVQLREFPGITAILTTTQGMTLYRRLPGEFSLGTQYLFGGARPYDPAYGYRLGLKGCDSTCGKDWTPLRASARAQSTGYWYLVKRADGSSVWAYKGFVLYTYSKDQVPGDYMGDRQSELLVSEDPRVETKIPVDPGPNDDDVNAPSSGVMSWMRAQTF
jgi:predicted lipoprotein with Yx(FWY)xxD motif